MNTKVLCNKALFVLRILLGIAMIYFGAMKIGAPEMMVNFVGGAGAKMGLGFLSVQTWFWIAVVGEILAGVLLILGGKWAKIGAILTLIIMVFVGNAIGWDVSNVNFVLTTLASLVVLFYGAGCWSDDPNCCGDTCDSGMNLGKVAGVGAMVGAGTQLLDNVKDKVGEVADLETLKEKAGDMLGSTGGLIEGAKDLIANNDMVQNIADKAGSMIEIAQDHVETISDKVMDLGDKAKEIANTAADYVPGMEAVADKVEAAVDFVQDKVEDAKDMVASAADKVDDAVEIIDADSKKA